MEMPYAPVDRLVVLPSHHRAPPLGVLPVHGFVLRGDAPVLIDAGMAVEAPSFLEALDTVIAPAQLRAIVITHEDADHVGALPELLARAPHARIVTSRTGAGKLAATLPLPPARLCIVTPGQRLVIGERRFRVLAAPLYDSPATFMLLEETQGWLFSSDAFGAFLPENAERAESLDARVVLDGMSLFCRANSPWVARAEPAAFRAAIEGLRGARLLLGSHLPPVGGRLLDALLDRAAGLPAEGALPVAGDDAVIDAVIDATLAA